MSIKKQAKTQAGRGRKRTFAELPADQGSAELIDRGGGLIYDADLNVTWLQDANDAKTIGYSLADANGFMDEPAASTWVGNLSYYDSVRGVTLSNWRLPDVKPVNGTSFNYTLAYDGSSDLGFHITSTQSELSHLYYVELGNLGVVDTTGTIRSPLPPISSGPFLNFQAFISSGYHVAGYWTGVTYGANPDESWNFLTIDGMQSSQYKDGNLLAVWPVRDSDVLPVPWLTISVSGTNAPLA
jgi:hypothetical protein